MLSIKDHNSVDSKAAFERRLDTELAYARSDGAAFTLLMAASVEPAATGLDWVETASRQLLVGDDWAAALPDGRIAFCLTETGPEASPAICSVIVRLGRQQALAYGVAHYPTDAKTTARLIDVAGKRLETNRLDRPI
jgi:hypothetical protein